MIPLSAILTVLSSEEANTLGARQKLARWLWCGVFGELYGGTTETGSLATCPKWSRGSAVPKRSLEPCRNLSLLPVGWTPRAPAARLLIREFTLY